MVRDPYEVIHSLVSRYRGKPIDQVIDAVLDTFRQEYGIYLPDYGIPYEELAHYIQRGQEDQADEFVSNYVYPIIEHKYGVSFNEEEYQHQQNYTILSNNPLLRVIQSYFGSQNTEELVHLYYNIEDMYPGYTPQEYEEAKNAILEELKRRHWYFCPVHNVPLETTTIAGVLYFRCPVGGELYRLRGNRLEPVSSTEIQRLRSVTRPEQVTPENIIGTGVQRPKRFTYSLGHYEVTKAPCDFEEMLRYAQTVFQKARIEVDWSQIHSIQDLKMLVIDVLSHLPPYAPNYMKEPLQGLLNVLRLC